MNPPLNHELHAARPRLRLASHLAAALAGLLLLTGTVHAESSAVALLREIRVDLFDLDLTDGIVPSYTWTGGAPSGWIFITVGDTAVSGAWRVNERYVLGDHPIAQMNAMLADGDASVDFYASGPGKLHGMSSAAYGQSLLDGYGFDGQGPAGAFDLSPHTEFRVSSQAYVRASAPWDADAASASVSMHFTGSQEGVYGLTGRSWVGLTAGDGGPLGDYAEEALLSVSMINPTDNVLKGHFSTELKIHGYHHIHPPVPEPSTSALLLAGLALAPMVWRRRRLNRSL